MGASEASPREEAQQQAVASSNLTGSYAALDLGSNSFHLIVAQYAEDRMQVVDKLKESVRIAAGLNDDGRLSDEVMERALLCLERFGQRLRHLPPGNVRVVGTNTLRRAKNSQKFLKRAELALGHKIDIIAGAEEARMIYLGVANSLDDGTERRLVVDIGGGSTELIVGRRFEAELLDSLHMGCVSMSGAHFADGNLTKKRFDQAIAAAEQQLEPVMQQYREADWDSAIGASGTILAVGQVAQQLPKRNREPQECIFLADLEDIIKLMIKAQTIDALSLPGLSGERAPVFAGGVAILTAIMRSLKVSYFKTSQGALREGLLQDLLGRVHNQDIRERTVANLTRRYHIDVEHAGRIRDQAIALHAQVAGSWALTDSDHQRLLGWAATLHEIGMDIAHSQYHKHGGYLLQHMEMPGFANQDQRSLALLVRTHRRKFPKDEFDEDSDADIVLVRLAVLLRLAAVLHRGRTGAVLPHIGVQAADHLITLTLPGDWLENQPLTRLDLEQEAGYLESMGLTLATEEV
ncbi:MAG: exopolyphosphatase [Pseudomonadales bacterium]